MNQPAAELCTGLEQDLRRFRFLSDDDAETLAPFFAFREAAAGETLWNEGDSGDYALFILSGHVEEKKATGFLSKHVVVGVYGKGTVIGQSGLLDTTPRGFTAVCLEDCQLLLLGREHFARLIDAHPVPANRLLKGMALALSIRLRKSYDRLAAIF